MRNRGATSRILIKVKDRFTQNISSKQQQQQQKNITIVIRSMYNIFTIMQHIAAGTSP